ncbi:MAG: hypothetical protein KTR25_12150 [Myxococcales bacterium]|nr:hypothetical protein [Myxococcales bacterium]
MSSLSPTHEDRHDTNPFSVMVVLFLMGMCLSIVGNGRYAHAHQQKEAYSTVRFNLRTGNLEIAHRFYVHDAEHAVGQFLGKRIDLRKNQQAQAQFAKYVSKHFHMRLVTKRGSPPGVLKMRLVGQEVEGKYIWIYQEVVKLSPKGTLQYKSTEAKPHGLEIKMSALQELWDRHTNQVTIEYGIPKYPSIRFTVKDDWRTLYF